MAIKSFEELAGSTTARVKSFDEIIGIEPPEKSGWLNTIAEAPKALAAGVERMVGGVGNMGQMALEAGPFKRIGDAAEFLANKYGPDWAKRNVATGKAMRDRLISGTIRWSDWWDDQASKGWEAPSDELMKAKWDRPLQYGIRVIGESGPPFLTAIAIGVITKNPKAGLAVLSAMEGSQAYSEQRKAGGGVEKAGTIGLLSGAWEAATESIPFDEIFKPVGKSLLKKLVKTGGLEAAQELIANMGQNFLRYFGYEADDWESVPAAVKEGLEHTMDNWLESVVAGGAMGVAGGAVAGRRGMDRGQTPAVTPEEVKADPGMIDHLEQQAAREIDEQTLEDLRKAAGRGPSVPSEGQTQVEGPQSTPETATEAPAQPLETTPVRKVDPVFKKDRLTGGRGTIDVEATEAKLPPVPKGRVRLYRAESPNVKHKDIWDESDAFSKSTMPDKAKGVKGKFYTDDLAYADYYRQTYGRRAEILYRDVTQAQADEYFNEGQADYFVPDQITPKPKTEVKAPISQDEKNILHQGLGYAVKDILTMDPAEARWAIRNQITPEQAQTIKDNPMSDEEYATMLKKAIVEQPKHKERAQLIRGHMIPRMLKWTDKQRQDFMREITGKDSMKKMSADEKAAYVEALYKKAEEANIDFETPSGIAEELIATAQITKQGTTPTAVERLNPSRLRRWANKIKSGTAMFVTGQYRPERLCEALDGHQDGPFSRIFARALKQHSVASLERQQYRFIELKERMKELGINDYQWRKRLQTYDLESGEKMPLNAWQRVGLYVMSKNKKGLKHLIGGYGLTSADIKAITNSMSSQEKQIADWMTEQTDSQWKILVDTVEILNSQTKSKIDVKDLKREYSYLPVLMQDVDMSEQASLLDMLVEAPMPKQGKKKPGFLESRKGGKQAIELDASILYLHNVRQVEHFLEMSQTMNRLNKLMNNSAFTRALNDATYGHGAKIFKQWLQVAGKQRVMRESSWVSKQVRALNRNGMLFALGYNIPVVMRQAISSLNAMAVDMGMMIHAPRNWVASTLPGVFKSMKREVYSKSGVVRMRSFDRDITNTWDRYVISRRLQGKRTRSEKVTSWIRWMDERTVVVCWKSLYDIAVGKGMSEKEATAHADKWIGRTQPMARPEDMPHFFTGGTVEKLLTLFQNQVNQNLNFWVHDIYGARKAGKINNVEVAYRVMFSYVLPALVFGAIGRGFSVPDEKDIALDLISYPVATPFLVGRWAYNFIRGFDSDMGLWQAAPKEAAKTIKAVSQGKFGKALKGTAATVGALRGGVPTAQMIRTAEGAYDLATDETDDYRRLVWSKYALNKDKEKRRKASDVW